MTAGLYVDYFGTGQLENAFHPTLQVCYMQGSITLPVINLSSNGDGSYRFTLPAGLNNPFLYCDHIPNVGTYFQFVSGSTWDLIFIGTKYLDKHLGMQDYWSNPVVTANSGIKVYYGGYRG